MAEPTTEISVRIDPGSLRTLVEASRTWDKAARRGLRDNLRAAAEPGVAAVRAEVSGPPPAQERASGSRQRDRKVIRGALEAGVSVSIRTGRVSKKTGDVTGEGVRVVARGNRLPEGHKEMLYLYGRAAFRHPVFGDTETWVTQRGKPWFYRPIARQRAALQRAVVQTIEEAAREIGGNTA